VKRDSPATGVSHSTRKWDRVHTPRSGKKGLVLGCLGLFLAAGALLLAYLGWANTPLPASEVRQRVLPNPIGYEICRKALQRLEQFGSYREQQSALQELRRGIRMDFMHPPPTPGRKAFPVYECGPTARRLCNESRAELYDSPRQAIDTALDAVELGSRVGQGGNLFLHAVGQDCAMVGVAQARRCLPLLSAEETRAVGDRLERITQQFPPLADALREERRTALSEVRKNLASPAYVSGWMASGFKSPLLRDSRVQKLAWFVYPKPQAYRTFDAYWRAIIREAEKPLPHRHPVAAPQPLLGVPFPPAGDVTGGKHARCEASLLLLRVELALQAYRRLHGRYPRQLADLIPAFLPSVPEDPFTGRPLGYQSTEDSYSLSSAGVAPVRYDAAAPSHRVDSERIKQAVKAESGMRVDGMWTTRTGDWAFVHAWENDSAGSTSAMTSLVLWKAGQRWYILAQGSFDVGDRPVKNMPRGIQSRFDRWIRETTDYD
jgi:hypothetical protein